MLNPQNLRLVGVRKLKPLDHLKTTTKLTLVTYWHFRFYFPCYPQFFVSGLATGLSFSKLLPPTNRSCRPPFLCYPQVASTLARLVLTRAFSKRGKQRRRQLHKISCYRHYKFIVTKQDTLWKKRGAIHCFFKRISLLTSLQRIIVWRQINYKGNLSITSKITLMLH